MVSAAVSHGRRVAATQRRRLADRAWPCRRPCRVGTFLVSQHGGTRRVRNTFAPETAGSRLPPSAASRFGRCPSCAARDSRPRARRAGAAGRPWIGAAASDASQRRRRPRTRGGGGRPGRLSDQNAIDDLLRDARASTCSSARWRTDTRWCTASWPRRCSASDRMRGTGSSLLPGPSYARRGGGRRGPCGLWRSCDRPIAGRRAASPDLSRIYRWKALRIDVAVAALPKNALVPSISSVVRSIE
jgi:hypothetical protein